MTCDFDSIVVKVMFVVVVFSCGVIFGTYVCN